MGDGSVGLSEKTIQEVYLAPNPAQNNARLVFSSLTLDPIFVSIVDMQGRIVQKMSPIKVLGQYSMTLDISELSNGLYNVVIDNGSINTYRLMKN
jgi:hypothetical protein